MTTVAIFPARGGSKRIPKKNIRDFCGRPMIGWALEAAVQSGLFDRVIVSTDSAEIAEVAAAWGGEVPFMRPDDISGDMAMTAPVIVHALEWLAGEPGVGLPENFCCIYPTAPFIRSEYLRQGFEQMQEAGASGAFSVCSFDYPIWRGLQLAESGRVEMVWPENETARSQDLPEVFHDAGQFYWGDSRKFLADQRLFADAVPVRIPRYLAQDIDTEEDWKMAEQMFKALAGSESGGRE